MKNDIRPLTRTEIFNHLVVEYQLRFSLQSMNPDSPDKVMAMAQRKAITRAVRETWYWFNNQEKFLKALKFIVPETDLKIKTND
jgi:hypothetical protein